MRKYWGAELGKCGYARLAIDVVCVERKGGREEGREGDVQWSWKWTVYTRKRYTRNKTQQIL